MYPGPVQFSIDSDSVDVNLPNGRVYKRSRITTKNTRIHEKKQIELEKYIERTQRIQEQQLEKRKKQRIQYKSELKLKGSNTAH